LITISNFPSRFSLQHNLIRLRSQINQFYEGDPQPKSNRHLGFRTVFVMALASISIGEAAELVFMHSEEEIVPLFERNIPHILLRIFSYLHLLEILQFSLVSQRIRKVGVSNAFWKDVLFKNELSTYQYFGMMPDMTLELLFVMNGTGAYVIRRKNFLADWVDPVVKHRLAVVRDLEDLKRSLIGNSIFLAFSNHNKRKIIVRRKRLKSKERHIRNGALREKCVRALTISFLILSFVMNLLFPPAGVFVLILTAMGKGDWDYDDCWVTFSYFIGITFVLTLCGWIPGVVVAHILLFSYINKDD